MHSHNIITVPQAVKIASQLPKFSLLGIYHFLKCSLQPKPSWNPRKELIKYTFTSSCSQMFSWQNLRPRPLSGVCDTWLSIKTWTEKVNLFLEQTKKVRIFLHYIIKAELLPPPTFLMWESKSKLISTKIYFDSKILTQGKHSKCSLPRKRRKKHENKTQKGSI